MRPVFPILILLASTSLTPIRASADPPEPRDHLLRKTEIRAPLLPLPSASPLGTKLCSVTSTGTVGSGSEVAFLTLTVTGPCDSTLAVLMRKAIADARAAFK